MPLDDLNARQWVWPCAAVREAAATWRLEAALTQVLN